ncbi:MAG: hypothetical protein WDN45_00860 [Caulobacteraceae bacterium]
MATAAADMANVTVRQLVRVSAGGQRLRLRLSNEAGADALSIGAVHVGLAGPDGAVVAGSDRAVTFDGRPGVTAPASSPVLSDPIDLPTKALDRLYISIYSPRPAPARRAALAVPVRGRRRRRPDRRRPAAQCAPDARPGFRHRGGDADRRSRQRGGHPGRLHHRGRDLHLQRLPRLARPAGRAARGDRLGRGQRRHQRQPPAALWRRPHRPRPPGPRRAQRARRQGHRAHGRHQRHRPRLRPHRRPRADHAGSPGSRRQADHRPRPRARRPRDRRDPDALPGRVLRLARGRGRAHGPEPVDQDRRRLRRRDRLRPRRGPGLKPPDLRPRSTTPATTCIPTTRATGPWATPST